jgi:hypothetical protein
LILDPINSFYTNYYLYICINILFIKGFRYSFTKTNILNKDAYLEKVVEWTEKEDAISSKSISERYEKPQVFTSETSQHEIQTDLSFVTYGGVKHYSLVTLKKKENPQKKIAKRKEISFFASIKREKLHLLAFNGHKAYIKKLVNNWNINIVIHAL